MKNKIIDAVSEGDLAEVKTLITNGNDINVVDDFGYSLLQTSISNQYDQISDFLISSGINLLHQDRKGQSALHYCAFYNKIALAKQIVVVDKTTVNIQDKYGNQPLWTAVFNDYGRNERKEISELLIKNGADIYHTNKVNQSPYTIVVEEPYINLYKLFGVRV